MARRDKRRAWGMLRSLRRYQTLKRKTRDALEEYNRLRDECNQALIDKTDIEMSLEEKARNIRDCTHVMVTSNEDVTALLDIHDEYGFRGIAYIAANRNDRDMKRTLRRNGIDCKITHDIY